MKQLLYIILLMFYFQITHAQYGDCWESLQYINVKNIEEDGNVLWMGTNYGLGKLDKTTHEITYYNSFNSPLPINEVKSLGIDSKGNKWGGLKKGGLIQFNEEEWVWFNQTNSPLVYTGTSILMSLDNIVVDKEDNIWMSVFGEGIYVFDGRDWIHYNRFDGTLISNEIHYMTMDKEGRVWASTGTTSEGTGGSIIRFNDINNWEALHHKNTPMPDSRYLRFLFDSNGNSWFATHGKGLVKYDGTNWQVFNTDNSNILSNSIQNIIQTDDGVIHITYGNTPTVSYMQDDGFYYDSELSNLALRAIDIVKDTQGINWYAEGHRILKETNGIYESIPVNHLEVSLVGINITHDFFRNSKWIGGAYGRLYEYTDGDWTEDTYFENLNFAGIQVQSVLPLAANRMMVGVNKHDGFEIGERLDGEWTILKEGVTHTFYPHHITQMLADAEQNIWILTNQGLIQYANGVFTDFDMENTSLPTEQLKSGAFDSQGVLWISSEEGLIRWENSEAVTTYTTENSDIPTNFLRNLVIDQNDFVWMVTGNNELVRFDGNQQWEVYTDEDFIIYGDYQIEVDQNNGIWTGNQTGAAHFDGENWTFFDRYNSPLTIERDMDIHISPDGEIWFGDNNIILMLEKTCLPTDIEDHPVGNFNGLQIFPNPAKSHLQIQIPAHLSSKPFELQLTNIEGRVILKGNVEDGTRLGIADLAAGIYIATWIQEGQALKREKVVVLE